MAVLDQPTSARKLAAILSADIAGYSAMMGADEEGTVRKLRTVREAVLPIVERFGGRVIDLAGDGILAEFPSAVRAVESAAAIQNCMSDLNAKCDPPMLFRIGVNVGDVIQEGERLYGDGINVAARLQCIAEPGGICVSNKVHEEVRDRIKLRFRDMGPQHLKNIARPVHVFADTSDHTAIRSPARVSLLNLPDRPSLAVLPFTNMSKDPEQEYFGDGVVEDIICALSRFKSLFVIARNSSFSYKDQRVDVRQIGTELGVRYVLQGGVRKASDRIRITAQLIDATNSAQKWADRFDEDIRDIFTVQDTIGSKVVGAIVPTVETAEIERSRHTSSPDLTSYDLYLRALACFYAFTREKNEQALTLTLKSIERDPEFAMGYALAARCYVVRRTNGWTLDPTQESEDARHISNLVITYGSDDAYAIASAALALAYVALDVRKASTLIDLALELNINCCYAWHAGSFIKTYDGNPAAALESGFRAIRLSPRDPMLFGMLHALGYASFFLNRFDQAIEYCEQSLALRPWLTTFGTLIASYAITDRHAEAHSTVEKMLQMFPDARLTTHRPGLYRHRDDFDKYTNALRSAGYPE